jgi:4-diphosphocytidyl-2-C-methyl-D-erythritol kinase
MIKKSYAKVNIFLKIIGKRDNYHLIISRFIKVKNQFDIIKFEKGKFDTFIIDGNFECQIEQNTIYKAYEKLSNLSIKVKNFFQNNKVVVDKKIPEFAGLGGGSSNCATFILMVNDICNLNLSKNKMATIGATIGADVPFFIYEYDSANVTGIGECVEKFEEESLNIETFTPNIKCDTASIFKNFRDNFYKNITKDEANGLLKMKSKDILHKLSIQEANDLYNPAINCHKELYSKKLELNSFFSGSGSSFFKVID